MKQIRLYYTYLFLISSALLACISCSKDHSYIIDELEPPKQVENPENRVEYYVKYESYVSIPTSKSVTVKVNVLTEKGNQTLSVPRSWEGTFGPFNELTTLSITGGAGGNWNQNMTSCRARISICRGNQPFILKEDKSFGGTSFNVKYTVKEEDLK
ncbi:MAG: hypothetical protein K2J12_00595 [Muribaculaceae bacterium]|nr:hypothetical protein [Muribaculaceae bacterium]